MNLRLRMIFSKFNSNKKNGLCKLFFLATLLFQPILNAEIIEIQSIHEILPYVDSQTLVVFDIDNTLIATKQMAGGDLWFQYSIGKYISEGFNLKEAVAKTLPDYMRLQHSTEVVPIEEDTAHVIHLLQKKGIYSVGLTKRSPELAYRTFAQLSSIGIHLGKNPPKCQNLNMASHFPLQYIEGILFVGHRNKGEFLVEVLNELEFPLQKIVLIDDKMKYVREVEAVCEKMRIPYIGFRYGGFDSKVNEFNPSVAEVQHKYLDKILSNEDAKKLLDAIKVNR